MRRCLNCPEQSDSDLERRVCLCKPGFYLPFYKEDSVYTCIPCPLGADCSESANTYLTLKSEPGWWRASNMSLNFYRCPIRSQCLGSLPQSLNAAVDSTGTADCAPPYFLCATKCQSNRAAALCTQCLPNYRESVSGDCSPCPKGNNVVAVVFIIVGILIAVYEQTSTLTRA
jgi:hypothetical protein